LAATGNKIAYIILYMYIIMHNNSATVLAVLSLRFVAVVIVSK